MKTIKIKDIEISAEELRRIVKENEALLKEPEVKGRYFFPKNGEMYFTIKNDGFVTRPINYRNDVVDTHSALTGKCFRTEADAKLALDKQKAIVACWKWQQENAPFEPDWGDMTQKKYYFYYDNNNEGLRYCGSWNDQHQFTLPYFKSVEDCEEFIKACKEHLTLLFTK